MPYNLLIIRDSEHVIHLNTMEKTVKKGRNAQKTGVTEKILDAFLTYKLTHGSAPPSIFLFCKELKIKEVDFYDVFNSFEDLEAEIWNQMLVKTIKMMESDPVYMEYSVREKLLAFYYSFLEELKQNRSYILAEADKNEFNLKMPSFLKRSKETFSGYINNLLLEGKDTSEVAERPIIEKQYANLFWMQLLFLIHFWVKDTSRKFEKTDAAIEKTVNLSFDLIGKGAIDSMLDFAKFMYQNRMQ